MTAHEPNAFDQLLLAFLVIPADRLRAICRQLAPAFEAHKTIAVLNTVRISTSRSGTLFRITDLDIHITVDAHDLTCNVPFDICVPFGLLRRIGATFDGPVSISHTPADKKNPARLTLATDDGCSATINLLCPPEDFPTWHSPEGPWAEIEAAPAQLRRMFTLSRPMVSTEETRYYLNGVHLRQKPDGDTLRAVATDGHRMAVIDGPIAAPAAVSAILPTRLVSAILALVGPQANEPVTLGFASHRVRIFAGQVRIDAKLIDGTFPDYTRAIPSGDTRLSITLSAAALRRLKPFATQRSNAVKFCDGKASMDDVWNDVAFSMPVTMTPAVEGADMTMPGGGGGTLTYGYNLGYLLTQAALTPTFRMDVACPSDPARVHGEDPDALWLIMPMRV